MNRTNSNNSGSLILIVDDVSKNLQVLGSLLMQHKFKVAGANSGNNALKLLESIVPDLILLDVLMPEIDGYETCRTIKKNDKFKDVPIIFLSAKVETEDLLKGFDAGGVDYITKPYKHTELLSRINTHIELKKSKDTLKAAENELRKLNATKDKFFSIIAHDLRSPFNALLGFSQKLHESYDEMDDDKRKRIIEYLFKGTQNTHQLLDNLLLWSRSQSGNIDINTQLENLCTLCDEHFKLLGQAAAAKNIQLQNKIPKEFYANTDRNMFGIVLQNLSSNAIKFTPQDGTITISAQKYIVENGRGFKEISIKDNGVGIAPERISKLFKVSENISTRGTENEKGTGLGLLLCKEFVEILGGEIWVESEVGKGSCFKFTLPE